MGEEKLESLESYNKRKNIEFWERQKESRAERIGVACPKCGKKLETTTIAFCPYCGAKIEDRWTITTYKRSDDG